MVVNVGGVFIYSRQPKALALWYEKHLGIKCDNIETDFGFYYKAFPYTDSASGKTASLCWSIMENKDLNPGLQKIYTVNYRVTDMEKVVEHLRSLNVEVKGIETHPEGKFAWCNDLDGNKIELWEDTTI